MKKLLTLLFTLCALVSSAQLGKYGVTVTSSISPAWNCTQARTYTFCVTVSNYNQCPSGPNASRVDGVEIRPVGNWNTTLTYVSQSLGWTNATISNDEPIGWMGWNYNATPPANQTWNDRGENTVAARTFCFAITTASGSDPCWTSNCSYGIEIYVWGDGDTGGNILSACSTVGTPDGPYLITNSDCPFTPLPVDLLYFKCEDSWLRWSTSNEANIKEFLLEFSSDTENWIEADRVTAKGGSFITYYNLPNIFTKEYYRLSEVDYNGKITRLSVISNINISDNSAAYDVYNLYGQLVASNIHIEQIGRGMYIIKDINKNISIKFIKQ